MTVRLPEFYLERSNFVRLSPFPGFITRRFPLEPDAARSRGRATGRFDTRLGLTSAPLSGRVIWVINYVARYARVR